MNSDNNKKKLGGLAAREKKGPLWEFLPGNDASFRAPEADYISRLYFPLLNSHGMKCSITPELKGDIASAFQNYLTAATVTEELHRNISGRNFWITVEGHNPWSAAGNSAFQKMERWTGSGDSSEIEGRIGAFISRRRNERLGLESEITVFVPNTDDYVELMKVSIKNSSRESITFTPVAATPLFGRHADNFRDHRQVTTMFQKVYAENHGVRIKPTIVHDEHGHAVNKVQYTVLGFEGDGGKPQEIWPRMYDFIGEGGSLDNPAAISNDLPAPELNAGEADGHEAIGAMRFQKKTLAAGETAHFIVLHGITENEQDLHRWKEKFGNTKKFEHHLQETLDYWQDTTSAIAFQTGDSNFNNWTRWVTFQLKCRQVFGNSYLPDFGYGRGGRGWRDLWQDLLSIFLIDPSGARDEILNNFKGIRIDGSNATIIGTKPGEFVADRNNVPRTWCDHGAWPVFVLNFYLNQTGDYQVLFEPMSYWKDQHIFRSRRIDKEWDPSKGNLQRNKHGDPYSGNVFEHLLLQQLSAFYNVGSHNNLLLEGGDWNDTLDMAREKGESVCFHNFYAHNLNTLAEMLVALKKQGVEKLELLKELELLLDRLPQGESVDYQSPAAKQERLKEYFNQVSHSVSGERVSIDVDHLITDLKTKAEHMSGHIRKNEWLTTAEGHSFFNGHYSNLGERIHGDHPLGIRMDLTSQVMPVMCDVADNQQINDIWKSVTRVLKDENSDGLRLCTDYRELDLNIGRITGFVYGNKEHGSKWMQQNIMLAYGLYKRGFAKQGHDILQQVYRLAFQSETALIFPGIPSYFNKQDRGAYAYLTGSSSWLLLTYLTQVFGVKGEEGNLVIQPALMKDQFNEDGNAAVEFQFAGREIRVTYKNPGLFDVDNYAIRKVAINGSEYPYGQSGTSRALIHRTDLELLPQESTLNIEVILGEKKQ